MRRVIVDIELSDDFTDVETYAENVLGAHGCVKRTVLVPAGEHNPEGPSTEPHLFALSEAEAEEIHTVLCPGEGHVPCECEPWTTVQNILLRQQI